MKLVQTITAAFCVLLYTTACHRGNNITIMNGDDNLTINYSGEIKFNDAETKIEAISRNGYLKYKRNNKKLLAENDGQGAIKYEMYDNGKRLNSSDAEGNSFLEDVVKDMIDIGFDAKGRIERLYRKGGSAAVLDAVGHLKMDNLKSMYFEYLLMADSLPQPSIHSIAKKIGSEIGSDYDKGRLLQKFPIEFLRDSLTARAWFESVKNIGADYEKANALIYLARQPLSKEQFNQTVDVTNTIGSDYEKANVLKVLIFKNSFGEENFNKTLDAVNFVGADYEKSNLLKALIEKEKPSADHFSKLIDVTEHVGADYNKTELIKQLIETGLPDSAGFVKLVRAVSHTGSEYDKANLLKDIVTRNLKTDEEWVTILSAAAAINSDNDKSNFLVSIAPDLPKSEEVKTAYMKAARTISQEWDLGRAVKAVQ